ncbi:hypothetical protein CRE_21006 [Caenorhabditis remanei]|uniref:Uncharacterized protein n=1 Tax=Caenorhabditis remanei TaxID=31234 RepID=E3NKG5_CAERE|nr:hypothetical protein CRE_21006 [Caenorhabditis remanei]
MYRNPTKSVPVAHVTPVAFREDSGDLECVSESRCRPHACIHCGKCSKEAGEDEKSRGRNETDQEFRS